MPPHKGNICLDCGKNMNMVGRAHRCAISTGVTVPKGTFLTLERADEILAIEQSDAKAALKSVTSVTTKPSSVTRVRKWRAANPELNKSRNIEYQRNKRFKEKTNAGA